MLEIKINRSVLFDPDYTLIIYYILKSPPGSNDTCVLVLCLKSGTELKQSPN